MNVLFYRAENAPVKWCTPFLPPEGTAKWLVALVDDE